MCKPWPSLTPDNLLIARRAASMVEQVRLSVKRELSGRPPPGCSASSTSRSCVSLTASSPRRSPVPSATATYRRTVFGSSPRRAAMRVFGTPARQRRSTSVISTILTSRYIQGPPPGPKPGTRDRYRAVRRGGKGFDKVSAQRGKGFEKVLSPGSIGFANRQAYGEAGPIPLQVNQVQPLPANT